MLSARPETPAEWNRCEVAEARCDEEVTTAVHRIVLSAHQPRPLPAVVVAPASRHRREAAPGCLKGFVSVGKALARQMSAWARRNAAHLCHLLATVSTSCRTSGAIA